MSDDLVISGKTYISSKKAAQVSGYAQDYIGQLSRGGLIDAQRVGGLWYIFLDSLTGYKTNAADFKPQQPAAAPAHDPESMVSFDGKDYVSASRAAKITGYNQDYVGQLARGGKILSRQIGNRWYVDRAALIAHKIEKDNLLAAVQSEAVGLAKRSPIQEPVRSAYVPLSAPQIYPSAPVASVSRSPSAQITHMAGEYAGAGPFLTYIRDDKDLWPHRDESNAPTESVLKTMPKQAPLRIRSMPMQVPHVTADTSDTSRFAVRLPGNTIHIATKGVVALTIVVVLSYGLVSMKSHSTYAGAASKGTVVKQNEYLAAASETLENMGRILESIVTKELVYVRNQK